MHRFAACFSLFLTVALPHKAEAAFADDEVLHYAFDGSTSSTETTEGNATGLDLTLNGATLSNGQTLDTLLAKSWDSGNALYCDGTTARATHSDNNT